MTGIGFALAGGLLIGLSATGLLLLNGRIAGISGILAGLAEPVRSLRAANAAFIVGLMLASPLYRLIVGTWPAVHITGDGILLVAGGLLVGFGTRFFRLRISSG